MHAATGIVILATVALIGLCRGAVEQIRSGKDTTPEQTHMVNTTLLMLGICVALCAVFAAYASVLELKRAHELRQLGKAVEQAKYDLRKAREDEAAAITALATARKRLAMSDELASKYEEEFLAARMVNLADRLATIKTETEVTQMVEWAERLGVFRTLGLGWGLAKPLAPRHSTLALEERVAA
jgi:hypothetical protein